MDEETGDTTVGLGVVGSGIFPEETGFDIFGLDIVGSGIFPEETGFDIFGLDIVGSVDPDDLYPADGGIFDTFCIALPDDIGIFGIPMPDVVGGAPPYINGVLGGAPPFINGILGGAPPFINGVLDIFDNGPIGFEIPTGAAVDSFTSLGVPVTASLDLCLLLLMDGV